MKFQVDGQAAFASTGTGEHQPNRSAVVLIHGAGMDHSVWVMPARHFARVGLNVLAPDLPGHGRSERPALRSIEDMANWLIRAMDALDLATVAVVGHSMGALVAYALAACFPERCRALALLGISAPMPVTSALLGAAADNHQAAIDMANTWSHSPAARLGANDNPGLWMLGSGRRQPQCRLRKPHGPCSDGCERPKRTSWRRASARHGVAAPSRYRRRATRFPRDPVSPASASNAFSMDPTSQLLLKAAKVSRPVRCHNSVRGICLHLPDHHIDNELRHRAQAGKVRLGARIRKRPSSWS